MQGHPEWSQGAGLNNTGIMMTHHVSSPALIAAAQRATHAHPASSVAKRTSQQKAGTGALLLAPFSGGAAQGSHSQAPYARPQLARPR